MRAAAAAWAVAASAARVAESGEPGCCAVSVSARTCACAAATAPAIAPLAAAGDNRLLPTAS